jgi:hypothetical protein
VGIHLGVCGAVGAEFVDESNSEVRGHRSEVTLEVVPYL